MVAGLLIGGVLIGAAVFVWKHSGASNHERRVSLQAATAYRNTRPGVQYMGDATCAPCHPIQAESYRQHPMGRSFVPVAETAALEKYDTGARNPFSRLGLQFDVARRPTGLFHSARELAPDGHAVVSSELPIHYVIGSGTRGRSYLSNRNGYLFQSPISWFTQEHAWDLSPRFEFIYPPDRIVEPVCLFCHANDAAAVPHTRNHYREPIFQNYAIGCERCHGPGELHVAFREGGDAPVKDGDDTIVNPGHLPATLREAVCQQCHLQGRQRFLRRGQETFSFRPGLPLHDFWSIFVDAEPATDLRKAVGQVEQMVASRCFRQSAGKLGCISCHDPHALPDPGARISYYRKRCLNCHGTRDCTEEMNVQREQEDSCMACHMPRLATADIAHTAVTNHRILRRPLQTAQPAGPARPGAVSLANFFEGVLAGDDRGKSRDLGVALSYQTKRPEPGRAQKAMLAVSMLEKATQDMPDDVIAWEALGWALAVQGREQAALSAYEKALESQPQRELTLTLAATAAERLGRNDQALGYLQRLVDINPWIWDYQYNFSKLLAQKHEWQDAATRCEAALRLHPTSEGTRLLLVTCYLHTGQRPLALAEFAKAVALNPKDEKILRDWFTEQDK